MELHIKRFDELTTSELYDILRLRVSVFIVEQQCPYPDLDGADRDALHLWYEDEGELVAYLRLLPKGGDEPYVRIGRVIAVRRRQGHATALLREAILAARERLGAGDIYLEAQVYAKSLYEKLGFEAVSEEFLEDGIPHVKMLLRA